MDIKTITGTYGSAHTESDIFCATDRHGMTWYVCEGSVNINATFEPVEEGVNIETLQDVDIITAAKPITSESELLEAIQDEI